MRSRAVNWADTLASRTDETVRIGILQKHEVLIIHHVFRPDDTLQTLDVGVLAAGTRHRVGQGAAGLGPGRRAHADQRSSATPAAPSPPVAALESALAQVRGTGASVEVEEWTAGVAGLAAPIRGHGGLVVGAIGIRGPVDRICLTSGRPDQRCSPPSSTPRERSPVSWRPTGGER